MPLFYRVEPTKIFTESFEYSGGWDGTILSPNPNFDSPEFNFLENFDSSWDGI
jgi:hypothetical protein